MASTTAIRHQREWLLVGAASVAFGLALLWATWGVIGDDAHITFTYSRNLADGNGFVFNSGDRTLSTTTPLTALSMAIPSLLQLDLQTVGVGVSIISAGVIAALIAINLRRFVPTLAVLLAIAVTFLHPFTVNTVTNEMMMYTALAIGAFHVLARRKFAIAGVLAALCALTRPDGGLVVVLVGAIALAQVWAPRPDVGRRERWQPFVMAGGAATAVLVPWLLFATWYFGSPVPVTLRAKQAQRESGHGRSFVELLDQRFDFYLSGFRWVVPAIVLVLGVVAGAGMVRRRVRRTAGAEHHPHDESSDDGSSTPDHREDPTGLWPVSRFSVQAVTLMLALAWNVAIVGAYIVLDVSAYSWYVVPLVVGLSILTGLGAGWLLTLLAPVPSLARTALSAVLAVAIVLPLAIEVRDFQNRDAFRTVLYQPTAEWIEANVASTDTVGTLEVGLIGYFGNRTLIDFAGLLQPDAATEAQLDQGFDAIALEAWTQYQPNYVAMLRPGIPTIVNDQDFRANCRLVHTVEDPRVVEVMEIYDCNSPAA
ncbi:MAG: glycosyltransferase family 87 protein [Actinomycetota bacterium]